MKFSGMISNQYGVENCNRDATCVPAVIIAIISIDLTTSDGAHVFQVTKRLENGDPLPPDFWTTITTECLPNGFLQLAVNTKMTRSFATIYLANEEKNILALQFKEYHLIAYKYKTPHGENEKLEQQPINVTKGEIKAYIPLSWIPKNITRISASVEAFGDIHNYYGIFNAPISIKDTMVIEEFKKVTLC